MFDLSQLTFDIRLRESALWHIPCRAEGETERTVAVNLKAVFNYFNVILTANSKFILKKKKNRRYYLVVRLNDINICKH